MTTETPVGSCVSIGYFIKLTTLQVAIFKMSKNPQLQMVNLKPHQCTNHPDVQQATNEWHFALQTPALQKLPD